MKDGTEETISSESVGGSGAGVNKNGNMSKLINWPVLREWLEEKEDSQ